MNEDEHRKLVEEAVQAAYSQFVRNFESRYQGGVERFETERHPPRTYADLPRHTREWLEGKNAEDLVEIDEARKLIDRLPAATRDWLKGKNEKDLTNIDTAVEFIGSSRMAAKVLMLVGGTAVAFLTGIWALAKAGIDVFTTFRGGQ